MLRVWGNEGVFGGIVGISLVFLEFIWLGIRELLNFEMEEKSFLF